MRNFSSTFFALAGRYSCVLPSPLCADSLAIRSNQFSRDANTACIVDMCSRRYPVHDKVCPCHKVCIIHNRADITTVPSLIYRVRLRSVLTAAVATTATTTRNRSPNNLPVDLSLLCLCLEIFLSAKIVWFYCLRFFIESHTRVSVTHNQPYFQDNKYTTYIHIIFIYRPKICDSDALARHSHANGRSHTRARSRAKLLHQPPSSLYMAYCECVQHKFG